ncbi:MAG: methylmalonyl-CoA mutase family protein [Myxococcota bacterium]
MDETTGVTGRDDPRWETFIESAAKTGAPLETLRRTIGGLPMEPVYGAWDQPEDEASAYVRRRPDEAGWRIRSPVVSGSVEEARRIGLDELQHGAHELLLVLEPRLRGAGARWTGGIELARPSDFRTVIRDVLVDVAGVYLEAGVAWLPASLALMRALERKNVDADQVLGGLGVDPIASWVRHGALPGLWEQQQLALLELVGQARSSFPKLQTLRVDVAIWPEVGADAAHEIGCGLSHLLEYARLLDGAGMREALGSIEYRVAAGPDVFETVCRFRALRRCLERIHVELEAEAALPDIRFEAMPLTAMFTRRDVHTNLVRSTLAAAGAALGGADSILALGFDHALRAPDAFSRRTARNIHHMLTEESFLGAVRDPAGGAHYVEARSEQIAEAAWSVMQAIEAEGGLVANLRTERLQSKIQEQQDELRAKVARRDLPIVGVSEYPQLKESTASDTRFEEATRIVEGPPWGGFVASDFARAKTCVEESEDILEPGGGERYDTLRPLRRFRWATDFENLRDESDRVLTRSGQRPHVFLACMGRQAEHNARSTWATNLLAAGGIEARSVEGPAPDALATAFQESEHKVAVVCGSDKAYGAWGVDLVKALRAVGASWVAVAGPEIEGAHAHVKRGDDVLAFLEQLFRKATA